jgi:hypothetical protein
MGRRRQADEEIDPLEAQAFCERWDRLPNRARRLRLSAAEVKTRRRRQEHWRDLGASHDWFNRFGVALRIGHLRPARLREARLALEAAPVPIGRTVLWKAVTGERRLALCTGTVSWSAGCAPQPNGPAIPTFSSVACTNSGLRAAVRRAFVIGNGMTTSRVNDLAFVRRPAGRLSHGNRR